MKYCFSSLTGRSEKRIPRKNLENYYVIFLYNIPKPDLIYLDDELVIGKGNVVFVYNVENIF